MLFRNGRSAAIALSTTLICGLRLGTLPGILLGFSLPSWANPLVAPSAPIAVPHPAAVTGRAEPQPPVPVRSNGVGALTLSASVAYALQHSPQVQLAGAQRRRSLAVLIPQQAGFHPSVTASASQSVEGPTLSLPLQSGRRIVIPAQEHLVSISAEQILYHAGASANQTRFNAQTASADAIYADALGTAAHDVMGAFYAVLQARSGEAVARQAVGDVQRNVSNVRDLIRAGQAVQGDLLTAQAALDGIEQDAAAAASGRRQAEANFNRTLGRPLSAPVYLNLSEEPMPLPASVEEATRIALLTRPDLRQRREDLRGARAAVSLAHSESSPTVTANAGYSLQTPTALLPPNEWALRATFSVPLLPTGQQQSDVAQAAAGVDAAEAAVRLQEDADALQILKAWEDLQLARLAVNADNGALAAQQEAFRATGLRHVIGEVTDTDVAQARLKLEQAASKLVRDRYNVSLRSLDLQYQMGLLSNTRK